MKRRWIIRGLFIGVLLLCVGGWAWSATHSGSFGYSHGGRWIFCESGAGVIELVYWLGVPVENGWTGDAHAFLGPLKLWPESAPGTFLGFGGGFEGPFGHVPGDRYFLTFPYWFAVLVSSGLLLIVWRKTRSPVKGRAFPVEAGEADGGTMRP